MTQGRISAEHIVRTLTERGHVAYFAGGCVRDEVLGFEPSDYDVATDATPDTIRELFPHAQEVGAAFGVMLVKAHGSVVEVATFREEGAYSDKRRPDEVRFSSADRDAHRRDFTINALFLDPLADPEEHHPEIRGRVIDYVDGLADLESGVVRAVGDPEARLAEDHLRALRAVRFASRLGFALDGSTGEAIRAHARDLEGVSRERIGQEIRRMLLHDSRERSVELLVWLGLDDVVLGERVSGEPRHMSHLGGGVTVALALAALALDRVWDGGRDWDQQGEAVVSMIGRWRELLCLSNAEREATRAILETLRRFEAEWDDLGEAGRKRLATARHASEAMVLVRARDGERGGSIEREIERLETRFGGLRPVAFVTGQDLVEAGFESGPRIGDVLERVYDAQLEGRVVDRRVAMELAHRLLGA
ncbi:MAG: CCA tRNA nucleotidyltransferase [Planctomycetota bacterium]|jgi:poly(A) polymerase